MGDVGSSENFVLIYQIIEHYIEDRNPKTSVYLFICLFIYLFIYLWFL